MTDAPAEQAHERIVVGVDGSESSTTALAWAATYAALVSAPLHVVIAWQFPTSTGWPGSMPIDVDFSADAKAAVDEAVATTITPEMAAGLDMTVVVCEGHPAAVLVEESRTAALVVAGSRGHGAFAGMMLGSVGQHLVAQAFCPVLIFRDHG